MVTLSRVDGEDKSLIGMGSREDKKDPGIKKGEVLYFLR